MKKRIVSIFLIVSIIVSVCAVGIVSTSAATCKAAIPTLGAVLPYKNGNFINVNWSHSSKNTRLYGVAFNELGTNNWIYKYTKNSKGRYLNVSGLKSYTNYSVRVYAYDLNGIRSEGSAIFYLNINPEMTWIEHMAGSSSKNIYTSKAQFGYNHFWSRTPSYYNIAQFVNKEQNPSKPIKEINTSYHSTGWYTNKQTVVCQIQAVYKIGNTEYTSGWSKPKKVS